MPTATRPATQDRTGHVDRTTAYIAPDAPRPYPKDTFYVPLDARTVGVFLNVPGMNPIMVATERFVGRKIRLTVWIHDEELITP
jgi:hypothetical protein